MAAAAVASMSLGGVLIATAPPFASPPSASQPPAGQPPAARQGPGAAAAVPGPARSTAPAGGSGPDLAAGRPASANSFRPGHAPTAAVDGRAATYWQAGAAFPQWLQVDLGTAKRIGSVRLSLPPSGSPQARSQTLAITGSADGRTYFTITGAARYRFGPAAGRSVTVTFGPVTVRYIEVTITASVALPGAQLAGLSVYPSRPGGPR